MGATDSWTTDENPVISVFCVKISYISKKTSVETYLKYNRTTQQEKATFLQYWFFKVIYFFGFGFDFDQDVQQGRSFSIQISDDWREINIFIFHIHFCMFYECPFISFVNNLLLLLLLSVSIFRTLC